MRATEPSWFSGLKYSWGDQKGSRNKRTLLREAEEALGRTRDPNEIVDMLHVIEKAASHFNLRAEMGKHSGRRKPKEIDEDYRIFAFGAGAGP